MPKPGREWSLKPSPVMEVIFPLATSSVAMALFSCSQGYMAREGGAWVCNFVLAKVNLVAITGCAAPIGVGHPPAPASRALLQKMLHNNIPILSENRMPLHTCTPAETQTPSSHPR